MDTLRDLLDGDGHASFKPWRRRRSAGCRVCREIERERLWRGEWRHGSPSGVVARRPERGRWRLGRRLRARMDRWLSTEQLGGAGMGKKTPLPLWAGWAD